MKPIQMHRIVEKLKEQEEQKIFKEFEDMGYNKIEHKYDHIFLRTEMYKFYFYNEITINLRERTYDKRQGFLTLKEHQLLHKLFELWGWFDE